MEKALIDVYEEHVGWRVLIVEGMDVVSLLSLVVRC